MTDHDPAKTRFAWLTLIRFSGVFMLLAGIAISQRAIDLPTALGYVLVAAGFLSVFIVPSLLAKRWRSPDE